MLIEMRNIVHPDHAKTKFHNKEGPSRIKYHIADRASLSNTVSTCIHPFNLDSFESLLVNVYTGEEAVDNVKVNLSYQIGQQQLNEFNGGLPESFHDKLSSKVITMAEKKKRKTSKAVENVNPDMEAMVLLSNSKTID